MNYTEYEGRYFISPLIGCKGKCVYCYLNSEGIKSDEIRKNKIEIKTLIDGIKENPRFIEGKYGSIISIGAYCDIFPLKEIELVDYSINCISEVLKLGNPVQIISKNYVSKDTIKKIIYNIQYKNQLLYSTTITNFKYWSKIEKGTSSPYNRLKTLNYFKTYEVPTNVMIKPFIPEITFSEKDIFVNELKNIADYCVVGEFYIPNNKILDKLKEITGINTKIGEERNIILDCSESNEYISIYSEQIEEFIKHMLNNGIKVFKKSSCVNSNIIGFNNPGKYYINKQEYCVRCGNCS